MRLRRARQLVARLRRRHHRQRCRHGRRDDVAQASRRLVGVEPSVERDHREQDVRQRRRLGIHQRLRRLRERRGDHGRGGVGVDVRVGVERRGRGDFSARGRGWRLELDVDLDRPVLLDRNRRRRGSGRSKLDGNGRRSRWLALDVIDDDAGRALGELRFLARHRLSRDDRAEARRRAAPLAAPQHHRLGLGQGGLTGGDLRLGCECQLRRQRGDARQRRRRHGRLDDGRGRRSGRGSDAG